MQKKYDPARGHVNGRVEGGHRTRKQARKTRRAMMLLRRSRYDRMRGAGDNWRRQCELLENVNSAPALFDPDRDAVP